MLPTAVIMLMRKHCFNCICFNFGQSQCSHSDSHNLFYRWYYWCQLLTPYSSESRSQDPTSWPQQNEGFRWDSQCHIPWELSLLGDHGGVSTESSHYSVYYLSNNEKENYSCEAIRVFGRALVILHLNNSYQTPIITIAKKNIYKKSKHNINFCLTQTWSPQAAEFIWMLAPIMW